MSVVIDSIQQHIPRNANLLVACSGGIDSVVLVHALIMAGIPFSVLHVNYHLRGEESNQDALFVQKMCQDHQVSIHILDCPVGITKGKGINLQQAAREFRHKAFNNWIAKDKSNHVVLAHHFDDQIETFFLQLARGSGLFGLGGMHHNKNGLIRPFLQISKSQLIQFAQDNGIIWREDRSNTSLDYARNRLRHELIPILASYSPTIISSIHTIQQAFRNEQRQIETQLIERIEQFKQDGYCTYDDWETMIFEEKLVFTKIMKWPTSILHRIESLKTAQLSAQIDETEIIKIKNGFSWSNQFPHKDIWDFKSIRIEILPDNFTLDSVYLDWDKLPEDPKKGFASREDYIAKIGVNGKSNVFKLLKDASIPEQWRSTFPVLKVQNEVVWIPGVAVNKKYLATKSSTNIVQYRLK